MDFYTSLRSTDVYVEGDGDTVYEIEMQASNPKNLPKRSRYYQGMIAPALIEKGADYQKLKKCYIIFTNLFDPFERGRCKYTFKNMCLEDPTLELAQTGGRFSVL